MTIPAEELLRLRNGRVLTAREVEERARKAADNMWRWWPAYIRLAARTGNREHDDYLLEELDWDVGRLGGVRCGGGRLEDARPSGFTEVLEPRLRAKSSPVCPAPRIGVAAVVALLAIRGASPVWFIAEAPSLKRVEGAGARTPELQWTVSPGDKLFRRMLKKHGFKTGGELGGGEWRCYIIDVIKSSYYVRDWKAAADDVRLAVAEAWSPVLRFELEQGRPKLVVILGKKKTRRHLDHLVRKGLIPDLPESVTIYHYSYVASYPQGKLRPMHPSRVAAWDQDFARIAGRTATLSRVRAPSPAETSTANRRDEPAGSRLSHLDTA